MRRTKKTDRELCYREEHERLVLVHYGDPPRHIEVSTAPGSWVGITRRQAREIAEFLLKFAEGK